MANLQKFRTHEAENTQAAATWENKSTHTVSDTTTNEDVSSYHTVHLMTDNDLCFEFSSGTTDIIDTAHALYVKGGDTIYSFRVPHGLGNTVIMQLKRKTSDSCSVKLILS